MSITDTPSWLNRLKNSRRIATGFDIKWYDEKKYKKYIPFHRRTEFDKTDYWALCENYKDYLCVGEGPSYINECQKEYKSYLWFNFRDKKKILYLQLTKYYPPLLFIPMIPKTTNIDATFKYYFRSVYDEMTKKVHEYTGNVNKELLEEIDNNTRILFFEEYEMSFKYYGSLIRSLHELENILILTSFSRRFLASGNNKHYKDEIPWTSYIRTTHSFSLIDCINFYPFYVDNDGKIFTPLYLQFRYRNPSDYINEHYREQIRRINKVTDKTMDETTPMDMIASMSKFPVLGIDRVKEMYTKSGSENTAFLQVLHLYMFEDPSLHDFLLYHAKKYKTSAITMIKLIIPRDKFPDVYEIIDQKDKEKYNLQTKTNNIENNFELNYDTDQSSILSSDDDEPIIEKVYNEKELNRLKKNELLELAKKLNIDTNRKLKKDIIKLILQK
jgi:hypothetical protein